MERMKMLLDRFEDYTASSKYFDLLWSKGKLLLLSLEKGEIGSYRWVESFEDLLEIYLFEVSSDVRDLNLCGEHLTSDLYPAEAEETIRRMMPYISDLPFEQECLDIMREYIRKCLEGTAP